MDARMNYAKAAPGAMRVMNQLDNYVANCGLEPSLLELVKLRASQLNGCAYCVNSHTAAVRRLGLDVEALGEVMATTSAFGTWVKASACRWPMNPAPMMPTLTRSWLAIVALPACFAAFASSRMAHD